MSKRKTGALRAQDTRYNNNRDTQTYYMKEPKTIKFEGAKSKPQRRSVELIPKSINQERYILSLLDPQTHIVVVCGPAGTGKTYLAMQAALRALQNREIERIILSRPAVGVEDERHGFLPGDINQKMEPWVKPLLDVVREYYSVADIEHMLAEQIIEIAPLAYCRGRNFKNSWVILDEAQNATPGQIKMMLTRIGAGSKIVVGGDIEQGDRKSKDNGLLDIVNRLEEQPVPGLSVCGFELKDVQRHHIIEHILKLYQP